MTWNTAVVDSRGSFNFPASLKKHFGLIPGGTTLAFRPVGGVLLIVPLGEAAKAAFDQNELDGWVKQEAALPTGGYTPPDLTLPKQIAANAAKLEVERAKSERTRIRQEATLLRERLRQEAANARHAQRMEMKNREIQDRMLARQQREARILARKQEQEERREALRAANMPLAAVEKTPEQIAAVKAEIQAEMDAQFEKEEAERKEKLQQELAVAVQEIQPMHLPQATIE